MNKLIARVHNCLKPEGKEPALLSLQEPQHLPDATLDLPLNSTKTTLPSPHPLGGDKVFAINYGPQ